MSKQINGFYAGFPGLEGLDRVFNTPSKPNEAEYSFEIIHPNEDKDNSPIQANNLTLLGMPGTGKSTLALSMAANLRTAPDLPTGKPRPNLEEPASILYYSLEQPVDSIINRLKSIKEPCFILKDVDIEEKSLKDCISQKFNNWYTPILNQISPWNTAIQNLTNAFTNKNYTSLSPDEWFAILSTILNFLTILVKLKDTQLVYPINYSSLITLQNCNIKYINENGNIKYINDIDEIYKEKITRIFGIETNTSSTFFDNLKQKICDKINKHESLLNSFGWDLITIDFNSKQLTTDIVAVLKDWCCILIEVLNYFNNTISKVTPSGRTQDTNSNINTTVPTWLDKLSKTKKNVFSSQNLILFPSLSPLPLYNQKEIDDVRGDNIFWRRYEELGDMITKIQKIRKDGIPISKTDKDITFKIPPLRMVVIDSLSMFANIPLTRYMVDQLFQLFAEKGVIGLLILEANQEASAGNFRTLSESNANVTAAADVVIQLKWREEENYSFRQINVTKSRHTPNAYGDHLFKLTRSGCQTLPSLHSWYTLFRKWLIPTDKNHIIEHDDTTLSTIFIEKDNRDNKAKHNQVVKQAYIQGLSFYGNKFPHFTFTEDTKIPDKDNSGILSYIKSIQQYPQILVYGPRYSQKMTLAARYALGATNVNKQPQELEDTSPFLLVSFGVTSVYEREGEKVYFTKGNSINKDFILRTKGTLSKITVQEKTPSKLTKNGYLLEIAAGFILPEELMWYLDRTIQDLANTEKAKINKLIFVNIGSWQYAYHLLYKNVEHGTDNFFPIMCQYAQYYHLSCLYLLSTGETESKYLLSCDEVRNRVLAQFSGEEVSTNPLLRNLLSFCHLVMKVDYLEGKYTTDNYYKLTFSGHSIVGKVIKYCPQTSFNDGGNGWDDMKDYLPGYFYER